MSTTEEEQLQTLPVNHPEAGYLAPAKDTIVATGTVPEVEQTAYDERTEAQEAEAKTIAEHEHDVATSDPGPPPDGGEGEGGGEELPTRVGKTSSSSSKSSSS